MKLLSNEVIKKYNYQKTRYEVDKFMDDFEENYFKYISVLPPSITSHISEINVQSSRPSASAIERYVINVSEFKEEFLKNLKTVMKVVNTFTREEEQYFKKYYFRGISENDIMEDLKCSIKRIIHIKKSCIIKFALALDNAILK